MKREINQPVAITAMTFRQKKGLIYFPRRMEFGGRIYRFKNGLQYVIKNGGEAVRIFDMTDGHTTYRLKCDEAQRGWVLISQTVGG